MELINDALDESRPISPKLYQLYSETLRKAVGIVGVSQDLQDQWLANVSRFAAYKAARATDMIREAVAANDEKRDGTGPLHAHARYLAAEANTARTRARTGKQWQQFNQDDHARLFPNIRWIASRSATPREAHMPFYGRVWAKDDPFWQHNQPGTLWNCKCDWEETDDPVTTGNPQKNIEVPGLKGNPAETGQIFSEDAPYFSRCPNKEIVEPIAKSIVEFERLRDTKGYKEMEFDWRTGAHKAVHKKHEDHDHDNEQKFFADKVSATQLEKECINEAYRMGNRAILLEEGVIGSDGKKMSCLDMRLNGRVMDIRTITENGENTIRNGLNAKNKQLRKYNHTHEEKANTVCLYFRDATMYSEQNVRNGIERHKECAPATQIQHVICIVKGFDNLIEFEL